MLKRSERLRGVDEGLAKTVTLAAVTAPFDVLVIEGLRTIERQKELYAKGRTTPGPKVTWTMASLHIGGRAVDVAPLKADGSVDWENTKAFDKLSECMFEAAKLAGVRLRWGADWDADGVARERGESDSPHFELA